MAAPSPTLGTTLHASASLAASGTASDTLDVSTKFEGQVMYKVTAGGTVAATSGLKIECFGLYSGSTYGDAGNSDFPNFPYTLVGYTAGQVYYSPKIFVPWGKWKFKITNLDASNAITVEAIVDTADAIV